MKKLILLWLLGTCTLCHAGLVQSKYCSGLVSTCQFTNPTVAGNTLIAFMTKEANTTFTVSSDSQGNPWVNGASGTVNFIAINVAFSIGNAGGTQDTITFSQTIDAVIVEWSGLDVNNPLDILPSTYTVIHNAGSPATSPSITTIGANSLLLHFIASEYGGGTWSAPTGFTALNGGVDGQLTTSVDYEDNAAAGTYGSVSSTYTGVNLRDMGTVTFALRKALPAAASPLVQYKLTESASATTATLNSAATVGNLLVASINNTTNSAPTMTSPDSCGNTWTLVCSYVNSFMSGSIYYSANVAGCKPTITVSGTSSPILIAEYQNVQHTSPLDVSTGCTAATEASGNMTTTTTDLLLSIYTWEYSSLDFQNVGTSWSKPVWYKVVLNSNAGIFLAEQDNKAAGTYSNTMTNTSSGLRGRGIVAMGFKWLAPPPTVNPVKHRTVTIQ